MSEETHKKYMREAIRLASDNISNGGGPFGAILVKNGKIVGKGVNRVTANNDPTAHAEIIAIRDAAQRLNTFDLNGCTIYTSCEPCPMCLGAIYWARISHIFYGNSQQDAAHVGFDDRFIYKEIEKPLIDRSIPTHQLLNNEAIENFKDWTSNNDKQEY